MTIADLNDLGLLVDSALVLARQLDEKTIAYLLSMTSIAISERIEAGDSASSAQESPALNSMNAEEQSSGTHSHS